MPTTGHVNQTSIYIKNGPGLDAANIDWIAYGTAVTTIGDLPADKDAWVEITAMKNGKLETGYVDPSYIAWDTPRSAPAPAGVDWIYAQSTGSMFQNVGGQTVWLDTGYAGLGWAKNNPDDQWIRNVGPLPRGRYTIGPPYTFKGMPCSMYLTPDPANDMRGRAGFLIHNGDFSPTGHSSEGCICLHLAARQKIAASNEFRLEVIRDDPPGAQRL